MADDRTEVLRADCASCYGLCCVALPFSASEDFPIDKRPGEPCRNLLADFRCDIHDRLRGHGFQGCAVFDCFGAGQHVSQRLFPNADWRESPEDATSMFTAFDIMRQLNELRWLLTEVRTTPYMRDFHDNAERQLRTIEALVEGNAEELTRVDVPELRSAVGALLSDVSDHVRAVAGPRPDHRGADLVGARLRGTDLYGSTLRGALVIEADLRDADLRRADLLGADLRGADLRGADLRDALFLTQSQLNAAKGDERTRLPHAVTRPDHWGPGQQGSFTRTRERGPQPARRRADQRS
ncbi:MAG: pentapeptide repeat-containing protein [Phycicoccus sp.]